MRTTLVVLGVLLSAVLVACGGDDDGADGDPDVGSPSAEAGAGGSGGDGGDAVEIAPFSMPVPPGAIEENFRTDIGIQLFYSTDDYDDIVAFFDDWTASESETYERFDRDDPVGVGWVWLDDATPQNRTIDVQQTLDAGNLGSVTWVQIVDEKTP